MKKFYYLVLTLVLTSFARNADSSQVRVDSIGGTSLVVTDETADINPYNLGNPAGLALLPSQTRLQISTPWYEVNNQTNSASYQSFWVSAADPYEGFMDINNSFAFEIGGGFNSGEADWLSLSSQSNFQNGVGSVQIAKNTGPFSLGFNTNFNTGSVNASFESLNQSATNSIFGLLANIPIVETNHPAWLRLGGSFSFEINPAETNYFFNNNSASVTNTYKNSINIWEPCVFLDIPGIFQGDVVASFNNNSTTTSTTSSNTAIVQDTPAYLNNTDNNFSFNATYKWKLNLSKAMDAHPLSFNTGARFEITNDNSTQLQSNGSTLFVSQTSSELLQIGLGLESEKNFTAGIQGYFYGTNSTVSSTNPPSINHSVSMTQISVGSEKWISPTWALRLGLMYEDDANPIINGNGSSAWEGYYMIYPGQEIRGVLASLGAGYDDKVFIVDGRLWFEQPQSLGQGLTGPDYANTLFGAEISIALSWGS